MNLLAKITSYLLHPIWMPLYVIFIFWRLNSVAHFYTHQFLWLTVIAIVIFNSILIPLGLIWMMKKLHLIGSLSLNESKDRVYPFLITGIFYVTSWYVFYQLEMMDFIADIFALSSFLVLMVFMINFFWKISIHSVSMGALSVFIIYLSAFHYINSLWPSYLIILLSGIVGWARLQLKSHNHSQVYTGYLLGAFITLVFFWN